MSSRRLILRAPALDFNQLDGIPPSPPPPPPPSRPGMGYRKFNTHTCENITSRRTRAVMKKSSTDKELLCSDDHSCSESSSSVCGSKRLGCHADVYTVSRCHTRVESQDHTGEKACKKGSTVALKPSADITRSPKQG